MRCKNIIKNTMVLLFCLMMIACTNTKLTQSWADPELKQPYRHLMIVGRSDSQQTRQIYEKHFVAELKKRNITATPSYTLINSKQKLNRDTVINAIKGTEIDSVLVTYLIAADAELKYRDSPLNSSYSGSHSDNMMSDTLISSRGRASTEEIISLKNDLYDAKTESVVWSAQTRTVAVDSIDVMIREVTRLLIDQLFDDDVLK